MTHSSNIILFFFSVIRVTKSPTLSVWESGEKDPFKFEKKKKSVKDQEQIYFFHKSAIHSGYCEQQSD